jgi:hypothetical protein
MGIVFVQGFSSGLETHHRPITVLIEIRFTAGSACFITCQNMKRLFGNIPNKLDKRPHLSFIVTDLMP